MNTEMGKEGRKGKMGSNYDGGIGTIIIIVWVSERGGEIFRPFPFIAAFSPTNELRTITVAANASKKWWVNSDSQEL